MAGLHSHLLAHEDLKDELAKLRAGTDLGDTDASNMDRWQEWLCRDAPRVLADTFCACLAAMLLDGTWRGAYWQMRALVGRYVLGPQLAAMELLEGSPYVWAEPIPWADLDPAVAERLWQDAAERGVVARLAGGVPAGELDDLHIAKLMGSDCWDDPWCTGSCPQTALLRAMLLWRKGAPSCPPKPVTQKPPDSDQLGLERLYCALCSVQCNSPWQLRDHRNGQKHRKRALLARAPGDAIGSTPPAPEVGELQEPAETLGGSKLRANASEFVPTAALPLEGSEGSQAAAAAVLLPGHHMGRPGFWVGW